MPARRLLYVRKSHPTGWRAGCTVRPVTSLERGLPRAHRWKAGCCRSWPLGATTRTDDCPQLTARVPWESQRVAAACQQRHGQGPGRCPGGRGAKISRELLRIPGPSTGTHARKNKSIGAFDGRKNFLKPICRGWYVFPIDPGLLLVIHQRLVQPTDKFLIFAGVRYKSIRHTQASKQVESICLQIESNICARFPNKSQAL